MIARLVFLSGALVCVAFAPAYGQDLLQSEIMVVDQACIERKVIQCMSIGQDVDALGQCPDGTQKGNANNDCVALGTGHFVNHFLRSQVQLTPDAPLSVRQAGAVRSYFRTLASMRERIADCRLIAEAFPSAVGTENCLKPLAEERTLNALTIELRDLVGQLCHLAKHPDCVDDAVPAEATAATPDNPAPAAAAP